jgi:hypothetical protein
MLAAQAAGNDVITDAQISDELNTFMLAGSGGRRRGVPRGYAASGAGAFSCRRVIGPACCCAAQGVVPCLPLVAHNPTFQPSAQTPPPPRWPLRCMSCLATRASLPPARLRPTPCSRPRTAGPSRWAPGGRVAGVGRLRASGVGLPLCPRGSPFISPHPPPSPGSGGAPAIRPTPRVEAPPRRTARAPAPPPPPRRACRS